MHETNHCSITCDGRKLGTTYIGEQELVELILNMDATPPTTQLPEEGGMCYRSMVVTTSDEFVAVFVKGAVC